MVGTSRRRSGVKTPGLISRQQRREILVVAALFLLLLPAAYWGCSLIEESWEALIIWPSSAESKTNDAVTDAAEAPSTPLSTPSTTPPSVDLPHTDSTPQHRAWTWLPDLEAPYRAAGVEKSDPLRLREAQRYIMEWFMADVSRKDVWLQSPDDQAKLLCPRLSAGGSKSIDANGRSIRSSSSPPAVYFDTTCLQGVKEALVRLALLMDPLNILFQLSSSWIPFTFTLETTDKQTVTSYLPVGHGKDEATLGEEAAALARRLCLRYGVPFFRCKPVVTSAKEAVASAISPMTKTAVHVQLTEELDVGRAVDALLQGRVVEKQETVVALIEASATRICAELEASSTSESNCQEPLRRVLSLSLFDLLETGTFRSEHRQLLRWACTYGKSSAGRTPISESAAGLCTKLAASELNALHSVLELRVETATDQKSSHQGDDVRVLLLGFAYGVCGCLCVAVVLARVLSSSLFTAIGHLIMAQAVGEDLIVPLTLLLVIYSSIFFVSVRLSSNPQRTTDETVESSLLSLISLSATFFIALILSRLPPINYGEEELNDQEEEEALRLQELRWEQQQQRAEEEEVQRFLQREHREAMIRDCVEQASGFDDRVEDGKEIRSSAETERLELINTEEMSSGERESAHVQHEAKEEEEEEEEEVKAWHESLTDAKETEISEAEETETEKESFYSTAEKQGSEEESSEEEEEEEEKCKVEREVALMQIEDKDSATEEAEVFSVWELVPEEKKLEQEKAVKEAEHHGNQEEEERELSDQQTKRSQKHEQQEPLLSSVDTLKEENPAEEERLEDGLKADSSPSAKLMNSSFQPLVPTLLFRAMTTDPHVNRATVARGTRTMLHSGLVARAVGGHQDTFKSEAQGQLLAVKTSLDHSIEDKLESSRCAVEVTSMTSQLKAQEEKKSQRDEGEALLRSGSDHSVYREAPGQLEREEPVIRRPPRANDNSAWAKLQRAAQQPLKMRSLAFLSLGADGINAHRQGSFLEAHRLASALVDGESSWEYLVKPALQQRRCHAAALRVQCAIRCHLARKRLRARKAEVKVILAIAAYKENQRRLNAIFLSQCPRPALPRIGEDDEGEPPFQCRYIEDEVFGHLEPHFF